MYWYLCVWTWLLCKRDNHCVCAWCKVRSRLTSPAPRYTSRRQSCSRRKLRRWWSQRRKKNPSGRYALIIIINNNNQWQCLWFCPHDHGHCESLPGSFDECRLSAGWPPTLRPSQPTWAVSPPINGCYHPHTPSPFVIITQPESRYSDFVAHLMNS